MRTTFVATLLCTVALAGCAGDDASEADGPTSAECLEQGLILDTTGPEGPRCVEPPFVIEDFEDPGHHCVVSKQRDRIHAPDLVGNPWQIGQWWDYELTIDGEGLGTTRLIYYEDQDFSSDGVAQHYMVGTPTREEALRHAIFSENPMIGRVHRILYSPHESGDHADMFHFPLCDGSSWTTVFYGETFTLTAKPGALTLPDGSTDDGFLIEGASPEGSTLRLSYSPAAQWFTFIDLDRADGGTVDLTLAGTGSDHTGPAFFLRGQQDAMLVRSEGGPAVVWNEDHIMARTDGGDGPYDTIGVYVKADFAGSGQLTLELLDPSGAEHLHAQLGGTDGTPTFETLIEVPYSAGDWTVRLQGATVDAAGAVMSAEVRLVSIYDRSGSV